MSDNSNTNTSPTHHTRSNTNLPSDMDIRNNPVGRKQKRKRRQKNNNDNNNNDNTNPAEDEVVIQSPPRPDDDDDELYEPTHYDADDDRGDHSGHSTTDTNTNRRNRQRPFTTDSDEYFDELRAQITAQVTDQVQQRYLNILYRERNETMQMLNDQRDRIRALLMQVEKLEKTKEKIQKEKENKNDKTNENTNNRAYISVSPDNNNTNSNSRRIRHTNDLNKDVNDESMHSLQSQLFKQYINCPLTQKQVTELYGLLRPCGVCSGTAMQHVLTVDSNQANSNVNTFIPTSNNNNNMCNKCKRIGHTANDCPLAQKKKKKTKNNNNTNTNSNTNASDDFVDNEDNDNNNNDDEDNTVMMTINVDPIIVSLCESARGGEAERVARLPTALMHAYKNALIIYQDAYPVMLGSAHKLNNETMQAIIELKQHCKELFNITDPMRVNLDQQTLASNCVTLRNDVIRKLYLTHNIDNNDTERINCDICGISVELHYTIPPCPISMTYAFYFSRLYGYNHCPICMHIPVDHYNNSFYEMNNEYLLKWRHAQLAVATFIHTRYVHLLKLYHKLTGNYLSNYNQIPSEIPI